MCFVFLVFFYALVEADNYSGEFLKADFLSCVKLCTESESVRNFALERKRNPVSYRTSNSEFHSQECSKRCQDKRSIFLFIFYHTSGAKKRVWLKAPCIFKYIKGHWWFIFCFFFFCIKKKHSRIKACPRFSIWSQKVKMKLP